MYGRDIRRILVCAVLSLVAVNSADAVVVYVRGVEQPIGGYVIREDAETLVIREILANGKASERTLRKSELADVIVTVRRERLEQLRPDRPQEYRDYAEELAEKRRDPEARDTALRLFVIAAWISPEELGPGALLAMIDLARDPVEVARFRALAYVLDPRHDPQLLRPQVDREPSESDGEFGAGKGRPEATSPLLLAIRQLRRGDAQAARRILEREGIAKDFQQIDDVMDLKSFRAACDEPELSIETLKKLLVAEIRLLDAKSADVVPEERRSSAVGAEGGRWYASARRKGAVRMPSLDLRWMTEFDPRECCYRAGSWTAP